MTEEFYKEKFKYFSRYYISTIWDVIVTGYIHSIIKSVNLVPKEIESLCIEFTGTCQQFMEQCSKVVLSTNYRWSTNVLIKFNHDFYKLSELQQAVIVSDCIEKYNTCSFLEIEAMKDVDGTINTKSLLKCLEYIFFMRKGKGISCLDLSNISFTDNDIIYFCEMIKNITWYYRKKIKAEQDGSYHNMKQKKKNKNFNMSVYQIYLSNKCDITHKNMQLLMRTTKKYFPTLECMQWI